MRRVLGIGLVLGVLAVGLAGEANADGCCDGFGWWLAPPRISPYSSGQIPVPPYFAIHPPVYYSHAIPRPYGYSPYAYPATTPPIPELVKPAVFHNPFVPKQTSDKQAKAEAASTPLVQANPFYKAETAKTAAR
jgi:hypothetical protein